MEIYYMGISPCGCADGSEMCRALLPAVQFSGCGEGGLLLYSTDGIALYGRRVQKSVPKKTHLAS
jgi:hypothetical protein